MPVQIALLRGINLGARNRIAMPQLRELLSEAGCDAVRTYVQSGNVVVEATGSPRELERRVKSAIADGVGLDIDVVARTRDELAAVVERNPLAAVATDPKRYMVSFLSAAPKKAVLDKLAEAQAEPEEFTLAGKEIYSWHPEGVGRSKLWTSLAGRSLGVTATGRNWRTVAALLAMADE